MIRRRAWVALGLVLTLPACFDPWCARGPQPFLSAPRRDDARAAFESFERPAV